MEDFPSKVTTETGSPSTQSSQQGGNSLRGLAANVTAMVDLSFIRSIPAILMMCEMFLGLLHWSLIASTPYTLWPVYGWVMFVAVTLWLLTSVIYFLILCSLQHRLTFVPWALTLMVYNGVAAVLYLTAFLANAASIETDAGPSVQEHHTAAAVFGAMVMVAYGVSAFFSYLDWRGSGGNAATNTVPT